MFTHPQHGLDQDAVLRLRKEAGMLVKKLREAIGLSQRELANKVGFDYYTFISQIESGRGRVPPTAIKAFAEALGVPVRDFAIDLMRCYDPITYELIFGTVLEAAGAEAIEGTEAELLDWLGRAWDIKIEIEDEPETV